MTPAGPTRALLIAFAWVLACITASKGHAHESRAYFGVSAGENDQLEVAGSLQWGFNPRSPWFFRGEGAYTGLPGSPRDVSVRFGGAIGLEGKRFGFLARYTGLSVSQTELSGSGIGGFIQYRFVTVVELSTQEAHGLSREDRQALLESRQREMLTQIPSAISLHVGYEALTLSSTQLLAGLGGGRLSAWIRWPITPRLAVLPKVEAYNYQPLTQEVDFTGVLITRSQRWVRVGPAGPMLFAFGLPSAALQLHAVWDMDPRLTLVPTITRVTSASAEPDLYSFRLALHRKLGQRKQWVLQPAFEMSTTFSQSYSFFTFGVSREFGDAYLP